MNEENTISLTEYRESHKKPVVETEKEKGLLLSFLLAYSKELQDGRGIDDTLTVIEAMGIMGNVLDDFFGRPRTTSKGFYSCMRADNSFEGQGK